MAKRKSMGLNAVLSGFKTALSVIFPLITFPYISRVLTVESVGKYNFAYSVMTYVSLFAALGISTYSIRECSKVRDNRGLLDKTASEIFSINVISTVISYLVLFALLLFIPFFEDYRGVILILSINVVFTTIGCEWIYPVYENYLYITLRSLITHLVALLLLFLMVRESDDVIPYAMVTVLATSGGNIFYLIGRRKYARIRFTINDGMKRHIKPIMTIFANTVTTSIYVNSDIIILEILTSDRIVGLYSASAKIYSIVKNILASVITVSVPRLSHYWQNKQKEEFDATCHRVFMALFVIGAPAMIGLASLSRYVVLLISSSKYEEAAPSLQILSVALLFSLYAWFFKSSILIPTGNEEKILRATLIASILNISLNFLLIPAFMQNAAAFTTLIAEVICLGFAYFYGRKYYTISIQRRDWISVILGCVLIFTVCKIVPVFFSGTITIVMVAILLSILLYFGILLLFKNTAIVFALRIVKKRLGRKRQ